MKKARRAMRKLGEPRQTSAIQGQIGAYQALA